MQDKQQTRTLHGGWNASLIALIVLLAGLLYVFGQVMSGDSTDLSVSVAGARVIDNTR